MYIYIYIYQTNLHIYICHDSFVKLVFDNQSIPQYVPQALDT